MTGRSLPQHLLLLVLVVLVLAFVAFPLVWMTTTALKPPAEIFIWPPRFLPADPTFANIARLFEQTRFATYFKNSVIVSSATVVLTLLLAVPGAYGLTRYQHRPTLFFFS